VVQKRTAIETATETAAAMATATAIATQRLALNLLSTSFRMPAGYTHGKEGRRNYYAGSVRALSRTGTASLNSRLY
jgi:hypothetical protein